MPAPSFATPQHMSDRTQGSIPASTLFLDRALAAASKRIRNHCGWHIYPVMVAEDWPVTTMYGSPLWLPTTHLVSVEAVTVGGTPVDGPLDVSEVGRIGYTAWTAATTVSFTHGFEEAPDDLVALTLDLAFGDLLARGVLREQTLASSVTWARTSGRLTAEDRADLAEYKIGYQP